MTIEGLNPDIALAKLLDNKVKVRTSATESHPIRCYADIPNKNLADEFIDVKKNGGAESIAEKPAFFQGALMLTIWCKTHTDGRAKKKIVEQIVSQVAPLVQRKSAQGFLFTFDPANVITPTTTSLTTGYSTTILNVKWHTTDEFHNKKVKP